MDWIQSWRCDPLARQVADRHYNRQSVGARDFVPPGRCFVLRTRAADAFWVTSWPFARYTKHNWAGAWMCSAFRRESECPFLASDLIRQAVAATRNKWPEIPELGMITFLDQNKVQPIRRRGKLVWGYTWLKAGFRLLNETTGKGLLVFQMLPHEMPPPEPEMVDMPLFSGVIVA